MSFIIGVRLHIFSKNTMMLCSSQCITGVEGNCLITSDVNLDHLVKGYLLGFATVKLPFLLCN